MITVSPSNTTNIAGISTSCLSREDLTTVLCNIAKSEVNTSGTYTVFDINGHAISLTYSNNEFKKALLYSDLIHADGQSIVFFSALLSKNRIKERSATTDLIHDICTNSSLPMKHYLLGGPKSVVATCGRLLESRYSKFELADFHDGYFSEEEEMEIIENINNSGANFLWVGLGKPKEQFFVNKWKKHIKVPVTITCGGCFNYITGEYARAPKIMQKMGLEWLYRCVKDPKNFLKRYLTTNPHAIYCAIKYRNSDIKND